MTNDNERGYERMSDFIMREKGPEQKFAEATRNLEECLSGKSELQVTRSAAGEPRVRAFIPDEDGYAGWIENASYVGAARVAYDDTIKYVAERHFPHQQGKPTYLWEFTPSSNELLLTIDSEAGDALDIAFKADADQQGYFLRLTQDLRHSW